MTSTLHVDRIEKNALVLKKNDDLLRFVSFYYWSIPLNPEYGTAKASNIFIDLFKFQKSLLGWTLSI
ncbi:hypothetical protein CXP54_09795 [Escherichia albertii]|nr:hypothetical protein CXP54_09795 [Escherichia albertii]